MEDAIQDSYPEDFAHCFGCGRLNEHGHGIRTFSHGTQTLTEHSPDGYYRGAGEFAYGGIIASLIDCHSAGSAAIFWMAERGLAVGAEPASRFVTARLEIDYLVPTPLGPLRLIGTADEVGDRKVVVSTDLSAAGAVTARGRAVLVRIEST